MKRRIKELLALTLMLISCFQPIQAYSVEQSSEQLTQEHWSLHALHASHGHDIGSTDLDSPDSPDSDRLHQTECHAGHTLYLTYLFSSADKRFKIPPSIAYLQQHGGPELPVDLPPPKS